jgi:hypothetical protein
LTFHRYVSLTDHCALFAAADSGMCDCGMDAPAEVALRASRWRPEEGAATEELFLRYAGILHDIRRIAMEHGYALPVHGSMRRDLDVVAVPWYVKYAAPEQLVEAIRAWVGGHVTGPVQRPHGRRCWSIHLGGGPYIDLSVFTNEVR